MKKRVLAALLVTMMTVGTVAGCGSNAKSDDSDKKASSESKSDDKKDSGKKVTVVTSGTGEPYSLISDDGKWTGIDAEMWDEIEKRTGWEVEVKQASFDAIKEERTDKYNATIPYYGDSQCIIVNDDSDYKTSDDLKGKTVGCTNGQAAQTIIEDMAKEKGFHVMQFNAVVASNTHALHLYERIGFTKLGVIPGGFRMPDGHYEDIIPHYYVL